MIVTTRDVISDEEIDEVHGGNFGSMSKRRVVDEGVLKYSMGYDSGHTQLCILLEHGLICKPKPGSYKSTLTKKGRRYLRAIFSGIAIGDVLDFVGASR